MESFREESKMNKNILSSVLVVAVLGSVGCSSPEFRQIGSSLLSQTGLVSESQANSMFDASDKLSKALGPLTDEQEYYIGRAVSAMVLTQYHLDKNPAKTHYLNLVAATVAGVSDRPETFGGYHVAILDTDEVNALSAPGGFIFVTRGFLSKIPNEEALASVLAHEVAHIVKGHGVSAISKANLTDALTTLGKEAASSYGNGNVKELTNAFGGSVTDVFNTLVKDGYSKSQEYEADQYAGVLLARVGYSTNGLKDMLNSLVTLEKENGRGGWFDTHPAPEKRLRELSGLPAPTAAALAGVEIRTTRFKKSILR